MCNNVQFCFWNLKMHNMETLKRKYSCTYEKLKEH